MTCTWDGCGKVLGSQSSLKSHMYLHTGNWPFVCKVCGTGVQSKYHLEKLHIPRYHSKVKPFPCEYDGCDMAFIVKGQRKAHYITKHGKVYGKKRRKKKN